MGKSGKDVFEGVWTMINWRKPIIYALLYLSGSKVPQNLKEIKNLEKLSRKELEKYQEDKLKKLLLHAYHNVPYYKKVLKEVGVINDKEEVVLKNFNKIPVLTKEIIRKEGENLYANDWKDRKTYFNTSGGSTGEPIKILQDKKYKDMSIANKIYYASRVDKDLGEREIKLWGSERDIFEGSLGFKMNLINFLYNRKFLNSFVMDEDNILNYVKCFNSFKPKYVWTYVESIYELARYVDDKKLEIYSPESIMSTAGVLTDEIRDFIESVFKTRVYNQYGSREAGDMAAENKHGNGMQVFDWSHFLEMDKNNHSIVTVFNNYSMPLIRYEVGDTLLPKSGYFKNGIKSSKIKSVNGRIINHFKLKNGTIIHGQFLIHQFYFRNWVKKFQIVQKKYDEIICKVVLKEKKNKKDILEIEKGIKTVMGRKCKIIWKFPKSINRSKSGKYLYTISKIK